MKGVAPIPEGLPQLTPHLIVKGARTAIAFYAQALGTSELYRVSSPDESRILFAELMVQDARFFVVDEMPEQGALSPATRGGTGVALHLFVEDVDRIFAQAVRAGMVAEIPVADFFWGERYGSVRDPFGHLWGLATRKEDLSPTEIQRRADDFYRRLKS